MFKYLQHSHTEDEGILPSKNGKITIQGRKIESSRKMLILFLNLKFWFKQIWEKFWYMGRKFFIFNPFPSNCRIWVYFWFFVLFFTFVFFYHWFLIFFPHKVDTFDVNF